MLSRLATRSLASRGQQIASHARWSAPAITRRAFSGSPQRDDTKQFMGFLHEDHEGAPWGAYAAVAVASRARSVESARKLAFLAYAFRDFDVNKDNVLSKNELKVALKSLNLPAGDAEVEKVFAEIDNNQDNVIQLDEWLDHVSPEFTEKLHDHANAESWRELAYPHHGYIDP